jgi:hypothetical protein
MRPPEYTKRSFLPKLDLTRFSSRRLPILLIGFVVSTFFVWFYPFHKDVRAESFSFIDWFLFPNERNPFLRKNKPEDLPQIYGLYYEPLSKILWAGGEEGGLYSSRDDGGTWTSHKPVRRVEVDGTTTRQIIPPIRRIRFLNETFGWITTIEDLKASPSSAEFSHVLLTTNAGGTWFVGDAVERQANAPPIGGRDYIFWKSGEGVTLLGPHLFETRNYGQSWAWKALKAASPRSAAQAFGQTVKQAPMTVAEDSDCRALALRPGDKLWLSLSGGFVAGGSEKGARWTDPGLIGATLLSIGSTSNDFGFGISSRGEFLTTASNSWRVKSVVEPSFYTNSVPFLTESWFMSPPQEAQLLDERNGWLLSNTSRNPMTNCLFRTTDGGTSWEAMVQVPAVRVKPGGPGDISYFLLNGFAVGGTNSVWLAGKGFGILHSTDGGKTWRNPMLSYSYYPPGWYLFVCAVLGLAFVGEFRRDPKHEVQTRRILEPDAPIEGETSDRFGFSRIARALARFFQNPETRPPFTVALTGPWGAGKSSLMNLTKEQLGRSGVRTVSFNAWHYQNEESVFASLLKNISEQAIPSRLDPAYWPFFLRLVLTRAKRHWVVSCCLLLLIGIGVGLSRSESATARESMLGSLRKSAERVSGWFGSKGGDKEARSDTGEESQMEVRTDKAKTPAKENDEGDPGPLLLALIPTVIALFRALRGFSAKPEEMLLEAAKGASIAQLSAKVSFQMRFKEQFNDVTESFGDKQLVLFIDDLDRCAPEKILEIMEAINFLVSAGKCFIVLGLSRRQIEAGLSLAFEKMAKEIKLDPSDLRLAAEIVEPEKKQRLAYARLYLKKLINLEIRLPRVTADQIGEKIAPSRAFIPDASGWTQRFRVVLPVVGIAFVLVAGFFLGKNGPDRWGSKGKKVTLITPLRMPTGTNAPGASNTFSKVVHPTTAAALPTNVFTISAADILKAPIASPEKWKNRWPRAWLVSGGALVIFGVLTYFLLRRQVSIQFKDSDEFLEALRLWKDEITKAYPSGRESLRFVNRVRYMALRSRTEEPILTPSDLFRKRWRKFLSLPERDLPSGSGSKESGLSEADVVAFSAYAATIEFSAPEERDRLAKKLREKIGGRQGTEDISKAEDQYRRLADELAADDSTESTNLPVSRPVEP